MLFVISTRVKPTATKDCHVQPSMSNMCSSLKLLPKEVHIIIKYCSCTFKMNHVSAAALDKRKL